MSWKDEYNHHIAVVEYMRMQYPEVLFRSDLAGIRLGNRNSGQVLRKMASDLNGGEWGRGWPDFFVAYPVYSKPINRYSHGLFIEFKQKVRGSGGGFLYLNEERMLSDKHLEEQLRKLEKLSSHGYAAAFSGSLDVSIAMIDCYLRGLWPLDVVYDLGGEQFLERRR